MDCTVHGILQARILECVAFPFSRGSYQPRNHKIWKEKEKDESHLKQMSPDCHLNSLGNMLESLHAEQDTTTPQPFWNTKDKPGQLPGPQQFSYPKVLGNNLQQKYNQLFWGLPSLHSESLVATVSIPETSSVPQSPFLYRAPSSSSEAH